MSQRRGVREGGGQVCGENEQVCLEGEEERGGGHGVPHLDASPVPSQRVGKINVYCGLLSVSFPISLPRPSVLYDTSTFSFH